MPNIAKAFKDEIVRLSRKEAKAAVTPVKKPSLAARKALADLVAPTVVGSIFHLKWGDTVVARTGTTRPMFSSLVSVARRLAAA